MSEARLDLFAMELVLKTTKNFFLNHAVKIALYFFNYFVFSFVFSFSNFYF